MSDSQLTSRRGQRYQTVFPLVLAKLGQVKLARPWSHKYSPERNGLMLGTNWCFSLTVRTIVILFRILVSAEHPDHTAPRRVVPDMTSTETQESCASYSSPSGVLSRLILQHLP